MSIFKYPVPIKDRATIPMPRGARILSVHTQQHDAPCVWAIVDPRAPLVDHTFAVFGTGHPFTIDPTTTFVGTFFLLNGALVFHLFDLGEAA